MDGLILGYINHAIICYRLEQENSPVVFCHNDMQEGNILMSMDQDKENNPEDPKLVIIGELVNFFQHAIFSAKFIDIDTKKTVTKSVDNNKIVLLINSQTD